jgi:hypothetical protein
VNLLLIEYLSDRSGGIKGNDFSNFGNTASIDPKICNLRRCDFQ